MRRLFRVVNLSTGLIRDHEGDTPTLDVPDDLDEHQREVQHDGLGFVHYMCSTRLRQVREERPKSLSQRRSGEACFVRVGSRDVAEHESWTIFYLGVRDEPDG